MIPVNVRKQITQSASNIQKSSNFSNLELEVRFGNYKDNPLNAQKFLTELGNPYVAIGSDQSGKTAIDWGVYGIPETFLLDKENNILLRIAGPITSTIYENKLKTYLVE